MLLNRETDLCSPGLLFRDLASAGTAVSCQLESSFDCSGGRIRIVNGKHDALELALAHVHH